jgi:glycosyltransferase involved in cell wall biosynthesis
LRILWLSNAPWAQSGYGEQTALFVPRLQALGHEMAIAANFGLQGATFPLDVPVYPANGDWGNPSIGTFAADFKADVVITLCDSWVMKPDMWPDVRMAIWAPIDHYPLPPAVLAVLNHERVQPIAMSRDGEGWMRKFKLEPLYVPHGVDTGLFRPQPELKDKVREEMGIPQDAFLVGMVGANRGWHPDLPRKAFPQAFYAFAELARERPDMWLYVHTQLAPNPPGTNLETLCKVLSIEAGLPIERVKFPPPHIWQLGFPRSEMASLYQAFDVLLNPSMGEGFGIPVLEAQACGVPVIASNHSAMAELTQAGWLVAGDPYWTQQDAFAFMPSIGSIREALEASYEARANQELREGARQFALAYDADLVTENYWLPALEELAKPREIPPLNGKVTRQQRRKEAREKAKAKT